MRQRVLVFQHAATCDLGNFQAHLTEDQIKATIIRLDENMEIPSLADFDVLIVLGGPMDVWQEANHPWLAAEKAAIRHWIRRLERPCLGICLGHQLLAEALGGKVGLARLPEVALEEISLNEAGRASKLFAGLGDSTLALQYHGAEVTALPSDGRVLGSSRGCLIAAMAIGPAAFGVQYHIEATEESVRRWSTTPPSSYLIEPCAALQLRERFAVSASRLHANSRRLYTNFMNLARRHVLAQAHSN